MLVLGHRERENKLREELQISWNYQVNCSEKTQFIVRLSKLQIEAKRIHGIIIELLQRIKSLLRVYLITYIKHKISI